MKKILSYITIGIITVQILAPFGVMQEVFAVTDSYDFDDDSVYTTSDNNKSYIHGWAAKLKWSLAHRWHLENGPGATDWATNLVVDWGYAYVTGYGAHAVTSIDISNPSSMSHAGYLWANGTRRLYWAYDLKKVWNFIYVASYISDSLEVIDATDPTDLKHEWRRTNITETKLNWAKWIDVVGNYAYIAAYTDDALQIIDISNPGTPVETGYLQDATRLNWATSVKVIGNYAYVTSYLHDSLQIIDISDPTAPTFVWQLIDDAVTELNGAWWIEIVWNYAYITAYNDDGFEIVDISDPTNPTHIWEIQNSDPSVRLNGARELKIVWNYAYVTAHVDDSIEVIDISNPALPTHAWFYDTDNFGILDWVFGIDISGTDVFVTSYNNASVMSFDITAPTSPVFDSELKAGPARLWNPIWLLVDWDYAYVSSYWGHSLEILDISDSANPTHVWVISDHSTNNELWWAWDVAKKWDYIYVSAYWDRWLETIDVSNPAVPVSTSTIIDSATVELQNPRGSYIEGNYLYVVSYYWDSLQIFDISAPATPVATWFYKDAWVLGTPNDMVVKWDYAFIADYIWDQVVVLDVSDPTNPVYETEIADWGILELNGAWDLRVDGDYLYVAAYIDNAVVVIDISDPTNPTYQWDLDDDGTMRLNRPRGIVYDEWYAYLSTYSDDSVVTFDVSDPTDPLYIWEIRNTDLYDTSTAIDKKDNDLFFTQYLWSSLSVVRESYPTDSPYIIPDNPVNSNYFNAMNITLGAYNEWNVTFQLSKDNGTTWYYYNWGSWVATTGWTSASNDVTTINTNIAWFNGISGWTEQIKWKAFLNSDGIQKVEIDQIEIDYFDATPPIIEDSFPKADNLIPKHDFDITFDYFDVDGAYGSWSVTENNGWIWIDTSSAVLKLSKWNGTTWWPDLTSTYINFTGSTVGTGSASYPTLDMPFGKYEMYFSIDDLNGNSTSTWVIFYIDEPEFTVSTWSIDIGTLNDVTNTFSDEVTITVKTVWAWFDLTMNTPIPELNYVWETIWAWDTTTWFGYEEAPYASALSLIGANQNIGNEVKSINTDGEKNTYTYNIKLWALINNSQVWWDYEWKIDFWINLDY